MGAVECDGGGVEGWGCGEAWGWADSCWGVGGGGEREEGCCVGLEEGGGQTHRAGLIVLLSGPMGGSVVQVSRVEALDGDAFGTAGGGGYTLYDEFLTTGL